MQLCEGRHRESKCKGTSNRAKLEILHARKKKRTLSKRKFNDQVEAQKIGGRNQ